MLRPSDRSEHLFDHNLGICPPAAQNQIISVILKRRISAHFRAARRGTLLAESILNRAPVNGGGYRWVLRLRRRGSVR
jgi:hypothetical protein